MTEKELIGKLRELRQIKPNRDWVALTKSQIFGEPPTTFCEASILSIFSPKKWWGVKPALATLTVFGILLGIFVFAQYSLPGDPLFSIKRATEKTQAVFVSEEEKPQASLELTNRRLEELEKIAKTNQVRNLAPAINEFQASVSEAAKNLAKVETRNPKEVKTLINNAREIKNRVEKIGSSYGVVIGDGELEKFEQETAKLELQAIIQVLKDIISRLEISLEKGALTEEKEKMLIKLKELVEAERYYEALELYLINQ